MRLTLTACLFTLLQALPSAAQDTDLRSLTTANATRGWEAVGKLNIGERSFCTGTLIEPDLVLTAAHCLYDRDTGLLVDPGKIEFLAGWRGGRAVAYRTVRRAVAHPDFDFSGLNRLDRVSVDLALLVLDQPIRLPSIQPFATDTRPGKNDDVGVVSYARDRSDAPSLQETCRVVALQARVLMFSCSADFGASGAPVFSMRGDELRIVSVISSMTRANDMDVSLGPALEEPLRLIKGILAQKEALPTLSVPRIIKGGSANSSNGAKFIKP